MTDVPPLPDGYEPHELPADYTGPLFIEGQMNAYARAAIEADRAGRGEPVAIVLKGSLDNLREYGHIGAPMFTPGNEPEQEWCVPLYTHPPAMRDSAREAMRTALEQLEHINRCIGLGTATIHYGSATWADTEAAIDALRAALGDE